MMEQIGALVYNGISLRSIPLYTNAKTTNYSRKMCQVILTRSESVSGGELDVS